MGGVGRRFVPPSALVVARISSAGSRPLSALLRDGSVCVTATFVLIPRVEVVETLGHAGFDAVILDLEHGPFTVNELPSLVAAAHGAGLHVIVRVERSDFAIGSVLDTGADAILVPHISSADDARRVVEAGRFPPEGSRSFNPYVRAAGYDADEHFSARANDEIALIAMVEGTEGISSLSEIASVPGLDGVFVGPVDLAGALGHPGEPEHPEVVREVAVILAGLEGLGVAAGVYCPTPEAARRWREAGARLVALSADVAMAYNGFCLFVNALNGDQG